MKLFIFDFDKTLTSVHTHHLLMKAISEEFSTDGKSALVDDPNARWELIKNIPPIASPNEWADLLTKINQSGHKIAFGSFNLYGNELIPLYLKNVLQLPDALLNSIFIVSMPEQSQDGKNTHIKIIRNHFSEEISETILIDDEIGNLIKAQDDNYRAILATDDGAHLKLAADAITSTPKEVRHEFEPSSSSDSTVNMFVVNHFSSITHLESFKNSIILTSDFKIYDIDAKGGVSELVVSATDMNNLLSTMNLAENDVFKNQKPLKITDRVNDQTRLAYKNIVLPPDFGKPNQVSANQPQHTSSTLKITLQIRDKTIKVENVTPNTTFRNFLQQLESNMTIGPSTRNNSIFVMRQESNINISDNFDKPLQKIAEEEFGANAVPDDITIKITRK